MILAFDDCELDLTRVVLRRSGEIVAIEPQVFDVLAYLAERPNELVRKDELLDRVWGHRFVSESALTTRVKSVRRAVGDDGRRQRVIRTVHGKGYEFVADVTTVATPVGEQVAPDAGPIGADRRRDVLPIALQSLIGRDDVLDGLIADQSDHRLVTLVGPGGVGKTALGLELARRVADRFGDDVFLVELVTVVDHDETFGAFATALDVNTRQGVSIQDSIVDMLRARHGLLVLDNCEHVVEHVAPLVGRILHTAPHVSIVATSREPLAVIGECVRTVDPLATSNLDALDPIELGHEPAIALFLDRARAADPRLEFDETTAPAIVEICRRLDGIPLAIELAASRASAIDVTEIALRLDERFRLLKGVRRGSDPRHRTLRDAISWSYDLLDGDERRMFESLAVFAGQFDLDSAESVCAGDDVVDVLTRLARRSMLAVRRPSGGGIRYEMLETLREYGRSRLDAQNSVDLYAQHAAHFRSVAERGAIGLQSAGEGETVTRLDGAFADLRSANRFALATDDVDTAYRLLASIREYGMRTLRYEVFQWADTAAGVAGGTAHPLSPVITGVRAYGAWVRGEFEDAVRLAEAARRQEHDLGAMPSGLVERVLGNVLYATGEVETGLVEGTSMIELALTSGNDSRVAHAYYMASIALSSIGHHDEARALVERGSAAARRSGSPTDLAGASVAAGFAATDEDEALRSFDAADRLARSAGNRWMSAFARTEAGGLLVQRGEIAKGCEGLADVVDVWYRAGEWGQQWHTLARCVIGLDRIGDRELATEVLGAIESHTTLGGPPVTTWLRDLTFEIRESLATSLGPARTDQLRAEGAAQPVAALVDRTRRALLGRSATS